MSYSACKNDVALWEKRSTRDRLSIEIAVAVVGLESGVISLYYYSALILYRIWKFSKKYTLESCAACCSWEQCAPLLYEAYERLLTETRKTKEVILKAPSGSFLASPALQIYDRAIEILSDKVEDLSFVKDEESRAALRDLAQVCKEAGPKLDDWRKSMDFLN